MTMNRWLFTGILVALLSTAASSLTDTSVALAQTPDTKPAAKQSAAKQSADNPLSSEHNLLLQADQISESVGQIRGLMLKSPFVKGVKNRDQLRSVLLEKLDNDVSDADIENESNVFKRLGIFPADINYKQMMVDMLTEQIAGFYDQQEKELYIMEGIPLDLQRPAMSHEIFHVIQDQHFDIGKMLSPFSDDENGDFALARMALIEGDATVLMIDFSLYEAGMFPQENANSIADIPMLAAMIMELSFDDITAMEQMIPTAPAGESSELPTLTGSVLASTPLFIHEQLLFPYIGGMRFVIMARSGHSWSDINEIYHNAPVSTEQIMHPERYFEGDQPTLLVYDPRAALEGYKPIYDTVFGELQLLLWLRTHLASPVLAGTTLPTGIVSATEAAKGWGGDRLMAFEDAEGNVLTTHLSTWDTLQDANEFFDLQKHILQKRFPDAKFTEASGQHGRSLCVQHTLNDRHERIYLEQWGDMILQIEGAPSRPDADGHETDPTTYAVRERVWQTFRRTPFADVYKKRIEQAANQNTTQAAE